MVNFTTPNLPAASAVYNKIASKVDSIEKDVMGKLESTASDLKASLEPDLLDLKAKTMSMIPELPSLPSLNLQAEITSLAALSPGSGEYASKLASIGTSFGGAISTGGYSLDSIVSDGASALAGAVGSLSAAIPNMELPPGATEAIEVAKASILPTIDAVKEDASKFSTDETVDEVKAVYGDVVSKKEQASVQTAAAGAPAAAEPGDKKEYQKLDDLMSMQRDARRVEGLRVGFMKNMTDVMSAAKAGAKWQQRGPWPLSRPGQEGVNPYTDGQIPVPMPSPDKIITIDDVLAAM